MNKKWLLLIVMFACLSSKSQTKPTKAKNMNNNKPLVYFKDGVVLNVRFNNKPGQKNSVIFFDENCIIIGTNNKMQMLATNRQFDPGSLPDLLKTDFFTIPNVNLYTVTQFSDSILTKYDIPHWLRKMSNLSYIKFDNIKLENMAFMENLKLKHLLLMNVEFVDRKAIINIISKIKTLDYLVTENLFTTEEVSFLKQQIPELIFLSEGVYNKKIEIGEINYPN